MRPAPSASPAEHVLPNLPIRLALTLALAIVTALALVPTAQASKEPFATVGDGVGVEGGKFNQPRGIAVNQTGNGAPAGTFYVVDGVNNRVQQFSPSGAFLRTWGWGVRSGEAEYEVCSIAGKCLKGTAGNNAGQLSNAQGIAVDQNTGNVFVANSGSRRISVFKPNGVFMGAFGWGAVDGASSLQFCTTGTGCAAPGPAAPASGNVGGGQFGAAIGGLATDSEGNLYVANRTSRRVDVFKPLLTGTAVTGVEFIRSFGWGAATGAAEFQVCTASPCKAPAPTGTGLGQFGANSPADVGVDSEGNIYALDSGNKRVQKFSSAPAPLVANLGAAALSGTFGTGNLIALAVEPQSNDVLVAGNRSSLANRVAIVEMTSEGAEVDTHGTSLGVNVAVGLAVAQPSNGGTIYLSSAGELKMRVFALNDLGLVPQIEAATGVSATEATFNGQVVSEEVDTAYRFEYSPDGVEWISAPSPDGVVPAQPGAASVQETVSGLLPDTEYRVRLASERPAGSWRLASPSVTFTTSAAPPTVAGGMATQVTDTSARLVAYVNPNNAATTYQFEYGTTEAYGSVFPAPAASAGEGGKQVTVSQVLSGLVPNTTYYFRVVASNAAGQEAGPGLTFTTGAISPALTGRTYEMVTPVDGNGQEVSISDTDVETTASTDGEAVLYLTWGPQPGAESGGFFVSNIARRGPDGWDTKVLAPAQNPAVLGASAVEYVSDDLGQMTFQGPFSPQPAPGGGEGTANLFHFEPETDTYTTITKGTAENDQTPSETLGGSRNLDTVVFAYQGQAPIVEGVSGRQIYVWTKGGEAVDAVAYKPGSEEVFEESNIAAYRYNDHTVSADGSKIYFRARPGEVRKLFVRIDGTETKHVSASQSGTPNPAGEGEAIFRYAAVDGSVAFFSTGEKLTPDATTGPFFEGADLYRWELATEELTDITVEPVSENGAEVQGALGGSDDGSRIYFVARGVLDEGAEPGASNLYMWTDDGSAKGEIEFVARDVEQRNYSVQNQASVESPARVTPDGSKVLFTSRESLTDYPTNGTLQSYLYDAEADRLVCVSCNPMGGPVTADVDATGTGDLMRMARTISADGKRVFFSSQEQLLPEDEDAGWDVYEYETASGQLTLLSSGHSDLPSLFQDASVDGRDVFIATRDPLVAIDTNETMDLYDVRIGGGFAGQNPPPPPPACGPGECQAPALPPAIPIPGSSTVQGPGDQVQKHKRAHKKKCKRGKKKRGKRCVSKRNGRR